MSGINVFLIVLVTSILVHLFTVQFKEKYVLSVFNNDQVEVNFKSELEACNLKWDNTCGIGIIKIDGILYYNISTKDQVEKQVKSYLIEGK